MTTTTFYLIAFGIGIVAGVYLPMNSRFGEQLGSPLLATAVFFLVGAATATLVWLVYGGGDTLTRLSQAQAPLFLLGVVSFGIILGATFFIPRMGAGAYFVCLVAGQVLAGLVLSHFGIFAKEPMPMTPLKLAGAIAVIAGVICIRIAEYDSHGTGLHEAGAPRGGVSDAEQDQASEKTPLLRGP